MPSSPANTSQEFPLPALLVAAICIVFAFSGVMAHDPWKNVDAVNLAIASSFAAKPLLPISNWVIPEFAGEPHAFGPPLYHWLSAGLGNLGVWVAGDSHWFGSARLASPFLILTGLFGISLAARGFHGKDAGFAAPLICIGTLGLMVPAHEAQPAVAAFAAMGLALAGLAWWELFPRPAALLVGAALGVGFLSDGLMAAVPVLGTVAVALGFPRWRRVSPGSWGILLVSVLFISSPWPLALANLAPAEFDRWLNSELSLLSGPFQGETKRFELLAWSSWPVLPIALWACWINRHHWRSGRHAVAAGSALVALVCFFKAREPMDAVPALIAPLALLGSAGANKFRRGLANSFDWFSAISISLFIGLLWLATFTIHTGIPSRLAKNFTKPAPGFVPEISLAALVLALALTCAWIFWLIKAPRSPWRASLRWSIGIALSWILSMNLLLPWIDYGKSYRQPVASISAAIMGSGNIPGCIERDKLTPAHRASLDLFAGIHTTPLLPGSRCEFRLVAAAPRSATHIQGWALERDVARPGERYERLRLYRRVSD